MNIVADWNWEQVDFTDGIESCIAEPERTGQNAPWGRVYHVQPGNGVWYDVRIAFDHSVIVACDNPQHPQAAAATTTQNTDQQTQDTQTDQTQNADTPAESAPAEAPSALSGAAVALPPPVSGSAAVAGFSLGGHVQDLSGTTVGYMQRAGMTWVKLQVRYNMGDSPDGLGGAIGGAHASGFRILLGIVGNPGQLGDLNAYSSAYAGYVAGAAALGADAIEVWNEPNIDREWPAGQINGASYTQLLAAAYNAIKGANPGTLVISGAPAPTGYFGGCATNGCDDDVFMRQMANAGAARYMDCIGLHYNEGIIPPNQNSGDPRGGYPTYYFSSMIQRGYGLFGGKKVCFTELGYLSGEGYAQAIPGNFGWAASTTVAEASTWLGQAASIAARSGKVALMIVWNVDYSAFTDNDPMGGYAMVRPDGSCPACDQLGAVMH